MDVYLYNWSLFLTKVALCCINKEKEHANERRRFNHAKYNKINKLNYYLSLSLFNLNLFLK